MFNSHVFSKFNKKTNLNNVFLSFLNNVFSYDVFCYSIEVNCYVFDVEITLLIKNYQYGTAKILKVNFRHHLVTMIVLFMKRSPSLSNKDLLFMLLLYF
jgi:hypothetical protein